MTHFLTRINTEEAKSWFAQLHGTKILTENYSTSWQRPHLAKSWIVLPRLRRETETSNKRFSLTSAYKTLSSQRPLTQTTSGIAANVRSTCRRPKPLRSTECHASWSSVSNDSKLIEVDMATEATQKLTLLLSSPSKAWIWAHLCSTQNRPVLNAFMTALVSRTTLEALGFGTTRLTARTRWMGSGTTSMTVMWAQSKRAATTS